MEVFVAAARMESHMPQTALDCPTDPDPQGGPGGFAPDAQLDRDECLRPDREGSIHLSREAARLKSQFPTIPACSKHSPAGNTLLYCLSPPAEVRQCSDRSTTIGPPEQILI